MSNNPQNSPNPTINNPQNSPNPTTNNPQNSQTPTTKSPKTSQKSPETPASPWVYSDLVKRHFLEPHNFYMGDESQYPADGRGTVGNPICGDQMLMMIQVDPATQTITDVKWKTYGCASALASTSALSDLALGRTLDAALRITAEEIADYLGGLPPHKFHCSVLGHQALAAAIENYRSTKS